MKQKEKIFIFCIVIAITLLGLGVVIGTNVFNSRKSTSSITGKEDIDLNASQTSTPVTQTTNKASANAETSQTSSSDAQTKIIPEYTCSINKDKPINLSVKYPVVTIESDKAFEKKVNELIKTDAFWLPSDRHGDKEIYGKLDCEVYDENKRILSVKYYGNCYSVNYTKEKYSYHVLCAAAYDMVTGERLYISDIYNITENFKDACMKYGEEQVPDVNGRPFFISWFNGDQLERKFEPDLDRPSAGQLYIQFFITETHLVLMNFMNDNLYYPFQIPLKEVAQDLKEEYKPYLSGK